MSTVGYVFGHFWNFVFFRFVFQFFQISTLQCKLAILFSKKIPQNKFTTCLDAIRDRFGHFRNIETFHSFHLFFSRTSRVHWGTILSEKFPRNMFKTCLIAFGNVFGHSQNVKFFPASWSCSKFWHSWVHWALFFLESYLKTSSKHVWTLLGTFLDTFEIPKLRFYFDFVPIFDPAGHDDSKKSPRNMFEHCWVRFWTFLKNWNIFDFFLNLFKSRPSSVY